MRGSGHAHSARVRLRRGFTPFLRNDYIEWKREGRLVNDGVNVKVGAQHAAPRTHAGGRPAHPLTRLASPHPPTHPRTASCSTTTAPWTRARPATSLPRPHASGSGRCTLALERWVHCNRHAHEACAASITLQTQQLGCQESRLQWTSLQHAADDEHTQGSGAAAPEQTVRRSCGSSPAPTCCCCS